VGKVLAIRSLNRVWLADITYIRIRTAFVYPVAISDAYSRESDWLCGLDGYGCISGGVKDGNSPEESWPKCYAPLGLGAAMSM
jgi:hypothetical protein